MISLNYDGQPLRQWSVWDLGGKSCFNSTSPKSSHLKMFGGQKSHHPGGCEDCKIEENAKGDMDGPGWSGICIFSDTDDDVGDDDGDEDDDSDDVDDDDV